MSRAKPGCRCWPVAEWPTKDRAAWEEALAPGEFLEAQGPASHWRPRSSEKNAKGYGRWIGWLASKGLLYPDLPPAERVTSDRVAEYMRELGTINATYTVTCKIEELYNAVHAMAPDKDWRWLARARDALRARAASSRDKLRRLQHPADLEALGRCLMAEADTAEHWSPRRRAVQYRDGLVIALLVRRPLLRLANLTGITIDEHLMRSGQVYHLAFTALETKQRRPMECSIPGSLTAALERYLQAHRPILLRGERGSAPVEAHRTLWVSETGTPMAEISLHKRIRRHTKQAFGKPLPPHWFRDAAATMIAIESPAMASDITGVLAHASARTAQKHYIQARTVDASRRWQDTVGNLHQRLAATAHDVVADEPNDEVDDESN